MFLSNFHVKKNTKSLHTTGEKGWKDELQLESFSHSPRNNYFLEHLGNASCGKGERAICSFLTRTFSAHCHSISSVPRSISSTKSSGNYAKSTDRVTTVVSDGKSALIFLLFVKTESASTYEDNSESKKLHCTGAFRRIVINYCHAKRQE